MKALEQLIRLLEVVEMFLRRKARIGELRTAAKEARIALNHSTHNSKEKEYVR